MAAADGDNIHQPYGQNNHFVHTIQIKLNKGIHQSKQGFHSEVNFDCLDFEHDPK